MSEEYEKAPAPDRDKRGQAPPERSCDECHYQDDVTGACTNDNCVDGSQFARALTEEDMYKVLYLLIFNMPLCIQKHVMAGTIPKTSFAGIPAKALEKFDEEKMKIVIDYDHETKRYILETSEQPKTLAIVVPAKQIRRRGLICPGKN